MAEEFVHGMAELGKALEQLPVKLERNVMRGAMRAGAKVQLAKAQELVPEEHDGPHPGELKKSLRIRTSSRRGVVRAIVTAGSKLVYWARWVELGTLAHFIRPKNRKSLFFAGLAREAIHHPGAKKKPFMRPALDGTAGGVLTAVGSYIRRRLDKEGIDVPGPENQ